MIDALRRLLGSRHAIPDLPSGIVSGTGVGAPARVARTSAGGSYPVRDLVKAVRWYGEVLGLKVASKTEGRAVFDVTGPPFEVHATAQGSSEGPGSDATFLVDDLVRTRRSLKDLGASLVAEEAGPNGAPPVLVYRDRDGNLLRVTAAAPPA